jgi:thioredoxin-dependent peroxiredoxin
MSSLQPGAAAPAIETTDHNDQPFSLKKLKGSKVVLYFYPKDDTPGCTKEACSFRDHHDRLLAEGYTVVGISPDSAAKHRKFIEKYELPFTLLPDTDHSIAQAYGVWGKKKFMGREYEGILRTTFLIDEKGKIARVIDKVDTNHSAAQVLEGA